MNKLRERMEEYIESFQNTNLRTKKLDLDGF